MNRYIEIKIASFILWLKKQLCLLLVMDSVILFIFLDHNETGIVASVRTYSHLIWNNNKVQLYIYLIFIASSE
jgi:hypothetical protein